MLDVDKIISALLDLPYISDIQNRKTNRRGTEMYECVLDCDLLLVEKHIPISICIPENWRISLVDIYLQRYEDLPFMPHVEANGKLCLFNLEGVNIDYNLPGIVEQCVTRAKKILEQGLFGDVNEEFVNEFDAYWEFLPDTILMHFSLPKERKSQRISYVQKVIQSKDSGKRRYCAKTKILYGAEDSSYFQWRGVKNGERNGFYCVVCADHYILPPDFRKPIPLSFFNRLLSNMDPISDLVFKKIADAKIIVFNILQPNGVENCIGVQINGKIIYNAQGALEIPEKSGLTLTPVVIHREDKEFLLARTESTNHSGKKILVIGAGSIGGYMCQELVHTGFDNIEIVDHDCLKMENIYRHLLGREFVDWRKVFALKEYLMNNYPKLNIVASDQKLDEWIDDEAKRVRQFDLIISTVGDHKVNRSLNELIINNNIDIPVIYAWNEPLDIGCHIAVISKKYYGNYECLFARDSITNELYDAVAYTKPGQTVSKSFSGCNGTFIPYGSIASMKTVALSIEWLIRILEDRCEDNYIISEKGSGYYFRKAGFETSDFYNDQKDTVSILSILELENLRKSNSNEPSNNSGRTA